MKTNALITYSKAFDDEFVYNGKDLGSKYSKEGTIFKVWCPLANKVVLNLYKDGESEECDKKEMIPAERGTWFWKSEEDLHGTYYDYTVTRGNEIIQTADPYAVACGVNGIRSMVVDLSRTNPEGFEDDKAPEKQTETILYELHITDFSYDPNSGVPEEYRGKYKAFAVDADNGKFPTCIEYLKALGITHVHLLPMYDFGWLDETRDDQYNWGYDPVNYNVPEGSFSTNPYDGAVRIRECNEMNQGLHKAGIRVVMDVVYNHTYEPDAWLERMVPGYYQRRWEDGTLANGSACGSDIAAGRAMVDNYIADSVMYWAKEYLFDGFRFDLMGLLTVELMNRIRKELDEEFGEGEKILYGEPWRATDSPMEEGTTAALKVNVLDLDDGVAMFSDDVRDAIKGHVFFEELPGFINGGEDLEEKILGAVTAWCDNEEDEFHPKSCNQIINYISAHDNFTLWDKLVMSMHGGHGVNNEYRENIEEENDPTIFTTKYEDVMEANKLGAFIYFTCQGHLFMQAGEEYGRTKFGDGNSYRSHPEINMMRWEQTVEFSDLLEYYKGLITLRKRMPGLCDKSKEAKDRIMKRTVHGKKLVSFHVDNAIDSELFVIYNANDSEQTVPMPEGEWTVVADKFSTDCKKAPVLTKDGELIVPPVCGMMLEKK